MAGMANNNHRRQLLNMTHVFLFAEIRGQDEISADWRIQTVWQEQRLGVDAWRTHWGSSGKLRRATCSVEFTFERSIAVWTVALQWSSCERWQSTLRWWQISQFLLMFWYRMPFCSFTDCKRRKYRVVSLSSRIIELVFERQFSKRLMKCTWSSRIVRSTSFFKFPRYKTLFRYVTTAFISLAGGWTWHSPPRNHWFHEEAWQKWRRYRWLRVRGALLILCDLEIPGCNAYNMYPNRIILFPSSEWCIHIRRIKCWHVSSSSLVRGRHNFNSAYLYLTSLLLVDRELMYADEENRTTKRQIDAFLLERAELLRPADKAEVSLNLGTVHSVANQLGVTEDRTRPSQRL